MSNSLPIAHHVTTRLEEDRVLARTPAERRLLARVVLAQGREAELLGFGAADTHLHLITALAKAEAQEFARRLEIALQKRLRFGSPFERARPRPIFNVWHLERALRYVVTQDTRHGLPGFESGEATSLPDLLAMRPLGRFLVPRVVQGLPRLTRAKVLSWVGRSSLQPTTGPLDWVPEAACRAAALPVLTGSRDEVLEAKRAALEVLRATVTMTEAAARLGLSRSAAYRLAERPAAPELTRAITLQLGWLHGAHAGTGFEAA